MKLEIGYHHKPVVREIQASNPVRIGIRVLYCSDLHLNRFGKNIVANLVAIMAQYKPEVVLLGGDYADTSRGEVYFEQLLQGLTICKHVLVIAGNHDRFRGTHRIEALCRQYAATWLEKTSADILINGYCLHVDGSLPAQSVENADFSLLCLHEPIDPQSIQQQYDLIVAGHLHGSQVVWWENAKGLYPGRLFYRWNLLQTQLGKCLYIISKGVGDTLPIRYNCKRDVLLISI